MMSGHIDMTFKEETKMKKILFAAALVSCAFNLSAAGSAVAKVQEHPISVELKKLGVNATQINPSEVPGMNEVLTDKGVLYVSDDGRFLLQGTMIDIKNKTNLTEVALGKLRKVGIEQFADSMIVYPAKDEKYRITVFTDITCGYCRKLHREMDDYHDAGITVQYLAFPRAGVPSDGYNDLQNIWCAADAAGALTKAKAGSSVEKVAACDAPVKQQFELGQSFGVSGTPAIIFEDGSMIPGYQPAAKIKEILDSKKKS